jgi:hypothetical protein
MWWLTVITGAASIEAGSDAIDRIRTGIEKLQDYEENIKQPINKPKCR